MRILRTDLFLGAVSCAVGASLFAYVPNKEISTLFIGSQCITINIVGIALMMIGFYLLLGD